MFFFCDRFFRGCFCIRLLAISVFSRSFSGCLSRSFCRRFGRHFGLHCERAQCEGQGLFCRDGNVELAERDVLQFADINTVSGRCELGVAAFNGYVHIIGTCLQLQCDVFILAALDLNLSVLAGSKSIADLIANLQSVVVLCRRLYSGSRFLSRSHIRSFRGLLNSRFFCRNFSRNFSGDFRRNLRGHFFCRDFCRNFCRGFSRNLCGYISRNFCGDFRRNLRGHFSRII